MVSQEITFADIYPEGPPIYPNFQNPKDLPIYPLYFPLPIYFLLANNYLPDFLKDLPYLTKVHPTIYS